MIGFGKTSAYVAAKVLLQEGTARTSETNHTINSSLYDLHEHAAAGVTGGVVGTLAAVAMTGYLTAAALGASSTVSPQADVSPRTFFTFMAGTSAATALGLGLMAFGAIRRDSAVRGFRRHLYIEGEDSTRKYMFNTVTAYNKNVRDNGEGLVKRKFLPLKP
jgi:hypothetical protein